MVYWFRSILPHDREQEEFHPPEGEGHAILDWGGDDGQCATRGVGTVSTVSFHRESVNPIHLWYILYVLGLKQNLVLVATLEDKGYDIIFNRGKAYLRHLASGCKKRIGVRVKNLYKLHVETGVALSS